MGIYKIKRFFNSSNVETSGKPGNYRVSYFQDEIENNNILLMGVFKENTYLRSNGSLCIYLTGKKVFLIPQWNAMLASKEGIEYYLIKVNRDYFKLYDVSPVREYLLHDSIWDHLNFGEEFLHRYDLETRDIINKLKNNNFSFDDLIHNFRDSLKHERKEVTIID